MSILAKLKEIFDKIPLINLIPIIEDQASRLPAAYDSLSDQEKQELAKNLLLAASKAAAAYGGA